jgi:hypothetical protein
MPTTPKYFIYLSKTKIAMLASQLFRKGFVLPEISPKISVPGLETTINFKPPNQSSQKDDYADLQKVLSVAQKNEWVKPLLHNEPKMRFLNLDRDKWHSGIWSEGDYPELNGAYINFKIHRDSLLLLIGSSAHLIGFSDIDVHIDSSRPYITTGPLLYSLPLFIKKYEAIDSWWNSKSAPFKIPATWGYCISLSEICLKKFNEYPETELEIMFMLYQKLDLKKALQEISTENPLNLLDNESMNLVMQTRRWLNSKVTGTDMLSFRYLYIGSPIYTAL